MEMVVLGCAWGGEEVEEGTQWRRGRQELSEKVRECGQEPALRGS